MSISSSKTLFILNQVNLLNTYWLLYKWYIYIQLKLSKLYQFLNKVQKLIIYILGLEIKILYILSTVKIMEALNFRSQSQLFYNYQFFFFNKLSTL